MSETEKAEGVKPHFLFMRFHGLLLVVPEQCVCVHRLVCMCVCVRQAIHLRPTHTHTRTYCTQSSAYRCTHREGKTRACLRASECDVHAGRLSRSEGVSDTVCNPPPTMYDPFVFCDRRGGEKRNVYLTTTVNCVQFSLRLQHPHSQSTCC